MKLSLAAVDLYILARAETTADQTAILRSDGFGELRIDLGDLRPEASEPGTAEALARGTFEYLKQQGYALGGFRAEITSQIPAGAGLSSSAAFGVLAGRLVSELFNGGEIPPVTLALAAQYGENAHFGKPCGLMDECACALGGVSYLDFRDPVPRVRRFLRQDPAAGRGGGGFPGGPAGGATRLRGPGGSPRPPLF